jgi:WD40 repeat protein
MRERGRDAVRARLGEWSGAPAGPTILYWVGHGWSDDASAALADARSPTGVGEEGLTPAALARWITTWEACCPDEPWLVVVVDACRSARFVELLAGELDRLGGRRRIALVGTSGRGAATLGRFTDSLDATLRHTFAADAEIAATRLCDELDRTIPGGARRFLNIHDDAVLRRATPVPEYAGSLDLRAVLTAVLTTLSIDERRHFVSKAQGGELRADQDSLGEVGWYFTGREQERQKILDWLVESSGMLVVTGRAGSGKSALLGDVLVRSRSQLARVLLDHGLLDPIDAAPPAAFDCTLQLTGLAATEVIARISEDLGVAAPEQLQPLTAQLDHLTDRVRARTPPPRLMVDALDEAVDPLRVAAVLRRLGAVAGIRLIVGTRLSTREGPDRSHPADTDLLDALAASRQVVIERDPDAIARYVTRRLTAALPGHAGNGPAVARAAASIRDAGQEILYARLAVYELLAQPDLLAAASPVAELLGPDHRSIFAAAVARLDSKNPAYRPLLVGLALAQGRGAPIRDGVWTAVAAAANGVTVTDDDVIALLGDGAPYLALDSDHGQTVYRLAHRTFAEHLTVDGELTRSRHQAITRRVVAELETRPNPYWVRYTSSDAAGGGLPAWKELDATPRAVDVLDPDAVARDAMRSLFGLGVVPPHIAGVVSAAHELRAAGPADRIAIRQVTAYCAGILRPDPGQDSDSAQIVNWASVRKRQLHAILTGHTGRVSAIAAIPLAGGGTLLATGSDDTSVRLWDPATGTAVGSPLTGHTAEVYAVTAVPLADEQTLLATGSRDGSVRLWDPVSGAPAGDPMTGHAHGVSAVAALRLPDGRNLLASGGEDGSVLLWDPQTCTAVGDPWTGQFSRVSALVPVLLPRGRVRLAVGRANGSVRLWDPATGRSARRSMTGHPGGVSALTVMTPSAGRTVLVAAASRGRVTLWNPITCTVARPLMGGHAWVTALAAVPQPDGRILLAAGNADGSVDLLDSSTGAVVGSRLTGHAGGVEAVAAVPLSDGRTLLATGGWDTSLRLWDPATSAAADRPVAGRIVSPTRVAAVPRPFGQTLLAAGNADRRARGPVWLLDASTGLPQGEEMTGHADGVAAMSGVLQADERSLLVTVGRAGAVKLWNPATRARIEGRRRRVVTAYHLWRRGDTREVSAATAVPLPDGRTILPPRAATDLCGCGTQSPGPRSATSRTTAPERRS